MSGKFVFLLFFLAIVGVCLVSSKSNSKERRDEVERRALEALKADSLNDWNLLTGGHEFLVGLYVLLFRTNTPMIGKALRNMAASSAKKWQKLVRDPRKFLDKERNPEVVLKAIQMLAMQKKFNNDKVYVRKLEQAIREKLKKDGDVVRDFFHLDGKLRAEKIFKTGTSWDALSSHITNIIFTYFAHQAGVTDALGTPPISELIKSKFELFRNEYKGYLLNKERFRDTDKYLKFHGWVYLVTHYALVLSDYTGKVLKDNTQLINRLKPEIDFLYNNLPFLLKNVPDTDMIGEIVDSLITFGVPLNDPVITRARNMLMKLQDPYGKWKSFIHPDLSTQESIVWFHTAMATLFGLRDESSKFFRYPKPLVTYSSLFQ